MIGHVFIFLTRLFVNTALFRVSHFYILDFMGILTYIFNFFSAFFLTRKFCAIVVFRVYLESLLKDYLVPGLRIQEMI